MLDSEPPHPPRLTQTKAAAGKIEENEVHLTAGPSNLTRVKQKCLIFHGLKKNNGPWGSG